MDKFQNKYRIPSARAAWHKYDGGVYFVTICTAGRVHYLGEIADGTMQLSDIGNIAKDCFAQISVYYPYAEIPLFTIMPNHIHAIVIINGDNGDDGCNGYDGCGRDAINRVSTTATISITKYYDNTPFNHPGTSTPFSFISSKHPFPFSVSTKYIWRLSCSPSLRVSRSLDSTERMVFEACEGVMPVLEVMSPVPRLNKKTEGKSMV